MQGLQEYDFQATDYTENGFVTTDAIDMVFKNNGDANVFVNTFPLNPGATMSIIGNMGEVMKKPIKIVFDATATIKRLSTIRRFYI